MSHTEAQAHFDRRMMAYAREIAKFASCDRKHVGCAITNGIDVVTGYNGAPDGLETCDEAGHVLENNSCSRVSHAEARAITAAARRGIRLDGATLFVTASPCWPCMRLAMGAGIKRIVFGEEFYRDMERIGLAATAAGIELVKLEEP